MVAFWGDGSQFVRLWFFVFVLCERDMQLRFENVQARVQLLVGKGIVFLYSWRRSAFFVERGTRLRGRRLTHVLAVVYAWDDQQARSGRSSHCSDCAAPAGGTYSVRFNLTPRGFGHKIVLHGVPTKCRTMSVLCGAPRVASLCSLGSNT